MQESVNELFELNTPVVFCTFNRIEPTIKVFSQIKKAKPRVLYLVSDAPRENRVGESEKVHAIRSYLEEHIDWQCDVRKIYATENMGCAKRISSALDEVFSHEEKAIILEDDCLPSDTFFEYCQTLLEWYKDDDRIISIAGCPEIDYKCAEEVDYFYSSIFLCWGWATWRRAWELYDFNMSDFDNEKSKETFRDVLFTKGAYWNYMAQFKQLYKSDTKFSWAYQFSYASIKNNKLNIVPKHSLIHNLGFSANSTHTSIVPDYYCDDVQDISTPLKRNTKIEREVLFDKIYFKKTQKSGFIVHLKSFFGLDINAPLFKR